MTMIFFLCLSFFFFLFAIHTLRKKQLLFIIMNEKLFEKGYPKIVGATFFLQKKIFSFKRQVLYLINDVVKKHILKMLILIK